MDSDPTYFDGFTFLNTCEIISKIKIIMKEKIDSGPKTRELAQKYNLTNLLNTKIAKFL